MATVARAAGVSPMTVSYTYNQPDRVSTATRARVREAADRLGYAGPDSAARSLRTGRADSLGVVLCEPLTYAFDDPQAARFLSGVASVCTERQLGLSLIPIDGTAADLDRVRRATVDGYVVWTTVETDPVLDAIVSTGKPVAILGGPARAGAHLVTMDNRAAAHAVTDLAFAGARRPAILSMPTDQDRIARIVTGREIDVDTVAFPVTRHRLLGARDHCLASETDWASTQIAIVDRNDRRESAALIAELLDRPERPDAIAAMSDELALAALDALAARGLTVPDDVAVTGWDDTYAAAAASLTTVAQSLYEQGQLSARLALGETADAANASDIAWHLVIRASTRM